MQKALTAAGEWTRFADPKALGVFVFLGLGVADLAKRASELLYAYKAQSFVGWLGTGGFFLACIFAIATVVLASVALFPRLEPKRRRNEKPSLFYFDGIAKFESPTAYEQAVKSKTEQELESEIANQAWEVARIASTKHRRTQLAYIYVIAFLVGWVVARVGLSIVS